MKMQTIWRRGERARGAARPRRLRWWIDPESVDVCAWADVDEMAVDGDVVIEGEDSDTDELETPPPPSFRAFAATRPRRPDVCDATPGGDAA